MNADQGNLIGVFMIGEFKDEAQYLPACKTRRSKASPEVSASQPDERVALASLIQQKLRIGA